MEKRRIELTNPVTGAVYSTAVKGWTLSAWEFDPAELVTNYIEVPGRAAGGLDLSTALTDGVPIYGNRALSVTLECSEGTRADRILMIKELTRHTGHMRHIILPDDTDLYYTGRIITVKPNFNDLAHASVTLTAICEPYKQAETETVVSTSGGGTFTHFISNDGDAPVTPTIDVSGVKSSLALSANGRTWSLISGRFTLPGLVIPPGGVQVEAVVNGTETATVKYSFKEAYL